ncbi:MAG TPA: EAL domain-containing protein [Thermoleophilaceae bacterium]|nr:EAL domain-containing protein [Thermoleophilaceae bacterium]
MLRRPLALEAKIWVCGALLAVAAAVVYWTLVRDLSLEHSRVDLPWGIVAAGFAAAERWVVHLHFRRSTHSLTLAEVPLVIGLLFLGPTELVAACLLGSSLAMLLDREIPHFKAFFNCAQFALGTCVALLTLDWFGIGRDPLEPAVWLAVFGAVSASTLLADVCVGVAISLAEGGAHARQRVDMLLGNWTVALSNTCLGLAAAAVVATRPEAGLLLVPPTALMLLAYRAYMGERRRSAELSFLYEATRTLSRSSEIQPELEALLERTAEAFRVSAVELVLFSAEPNRSARSSLARDGGRRMLEPMDEALAERLRGLAAGLQGPLDVSTTQDLELRGYFRARGMQTGIVAPLKGEGGCVGLFLVAGRESVDRSFTEEDLRLLETLTGNITVALQYDRLEQAVRQLETLQHELERKALYDSLTQLANRSLFHNRLEHALQSRRPGVCVLLLDIDEFKAVNDSHGHHAGDQLLRAVAERLRSCVRDGDTAARLGGDEFALLLDRSGDEADAAAVAERLMRDFESRIEVAGERLRVHISVGIAMGAPGTDDLEELLRRADVALYEAKRRGKGQYCFFHPSMGDTLRRRHTLARELERAVSEDELTVVYQPIVALEDCRAVTLEALVRWKHPERGLVPPGDFIAFAEETGAVVQIGEIVLERVAEQAAAVGVPIHVNVCAPELTEPGFLDRVDALVARHGLSPDLLVFEVTERLFVAEDPAPVAVLEGLNERGMRVAVDDFGTGYSSLAYLSRLPVDTMKIPKQFIDELMGGGEHHSLARAVIELGAALDLTVVAEGIEHPEQITALRAFGCEYGQGYYYGLPTDARVALKRVEALREGARSLTSSRPGIGGGPGA